MYNLNNRLNDLRKKGLHRHLEAVSGPGVHIQVRGKKTLSFCSNDYLGLAGNPQVIAASRMALDVYGAGSGSSRLIAGDFDLLRQVEKRLAAYVGREDALFFSSGYLANIGLLSALALSGDHILSDALNHASIIDGARLSRAQVDVLEHNSLKALQEALFHHKHKACIYVTESLFSMDGDSPALAPLMNETHQAGVFSVVDEAHALGIWGEEGRGLAYGLPVDAVVGTFGKAFGAGGAFVAGSQDLRSFLINRARSFIFTTAPPPAVVGAVSGALDILESNPEPREQLLKNTHFMHQQLKEAGFNTAPSSSHILPIVVGDPQGALALSEALFEKGYYVRAIRPPTVPMGTSRLRLTLSAQHSIEDLSGFVQALKSAWKQLGISTQKREP